MADKIIPIGDGFWNIRGAFRLLGMINIGTQASLVRLASGKFVMLDAYEYDEAVAREVNRLTDDGAEVEAVINTHPFHTVHCEAIARRFPNARHYGTARHIQKFKGIDWQAEASEDPALHERYATDLSFTVPRGVDFIPDNQNLHFASVMVIHRASKALHVDDTLGYFNLPFVGGIAFHPTLKHVLQRRPGAVAEFRAWAEDLIDRCAEVHHLCTAHGTKLPPPPGTGETVAGQVREAYAKIGKVLDAHERKYG